MSSYLPLPASSLETAYYTYYVLKIRNIFFSKVEEPIKMMTQRIKHKGLCWSFLSCYGFTSLVFPLHRSGVIYHWYLQMTRNLTFLRQWKYIQPDGSMLAQLSRAFGECSWGEECTDGKLGLCCYPQVWKGHPLRLKLISLGWGDRPVIKGPLFDVHEQQKPPGGPSRQ